MTALECDGPQSDPTNVEVEQLLVKLGAVADVLHGRAEEFIPIVGTKVVRLLSAVTRGTSQLTQGAPSLSFTILGGSAPNTAILRRTTATVDVRTSKLLSTEKRALAPGAATHLSTERQSDNSGNTGGLRAFSQSLV